MATDSPANHLPPWLLTGALAGLGLASVAALATTLLAPTPLPPPVSHGASPLRIPGYRLQLLATEPPLLGRRLSRSALLRYRVVPQTAASPGPSTSPMLLELVNLHSRSHTTFQVAALTQGPDAPAGLALRKRRLLPGSPPVAIGMLAGPALQTCLVSTLPGSRSAATPQLDGGVTGIQLKQLIQPTGKGLWNAAGVWRDLRRLFGADLPRLLGLEPAIRFECTLVSLSIPNGATASGPAEAALQRVWRDLAAALKASWPERRHFNQTTLQPGPPSPRSASQTRST